MIRMYLVSQGGKWRVTLYPDKETQRPLFEDADLLTQDFRVKWFAMQYAVKTAKQIFAQHGRPVSLLIQGKNGLWQEERTYPRSEDPSETPG